MAEERRVALERALEENRDLSELLQVIKIIFNCKKLKKLKFKTRNRELQELQDENSALKEILREIAAGHSRPG